MLQYISGAKLLQYNSELIYLSFYLQRINTNLCVKIVLGCSVTQCNVNKLLCLKKCKVIVTLFLKVFRTKLWLSYCKLHAYCLTCHKEKFIFHVSDYQNSIKQREKKGIVRTILFLNCETQILLFHFFFVRSFRNRVIKQKIQPCKNGIIIGRYIGCVFLV